jgi:hypothetical protein
LGVEDNTFTEVLSGLTENENVILGNRSLFRAGEKVETHEVAETAAGTSGLRVGISAAPPPGAKPAKKRPRHGVNK